MQVYHLGTNCLNVAGGAGVQATDVGSGAGSDTNDKKRVFQQIRWGLIVLIGCYIRKQ